MVNEQEMIGALKQKAERAVSSWLEFMQARGLDHYPFKLRAPAMAGIHDDNFGVMLGTYVDEFVKQGFTIVSHTVFSEEDAVVDEGGGKIRKWDPETDKGREPSGVVPFTCASLLVKRSALIRSLHLA